MPPDPAPPPSANPPVRKDRGYGVAGAAAAVAIGMLGLSFASVPLYQMFCKLTGYGGTTRDAVAAPKAVTDRDIEIRFDANVGNDAPLSFAPEQVSQKIKVGQTSLAFFNVKNLGDRPVKVVATYNATPDKGAVYFNKLQCFCYNAITLTPGENLRLPVVYFIDPAMLDEKHNDDITAMTLSYTFFEATGDKAKLAAPGNGLSAGG